MEIKFDDIRPETLKMVNGDMNLALTFEYIHAIIVDSKKRSAGLEYNGLYYVPDIMYRFEKAMPHFRKNQIKTYLKELTKKGLIIKEDFFAKKTHAQKTYGYRINNALVDWEFKFIELDKLKKKHINSPEGTKIRETVDRFIFNIREIYESK
tara:strand:- start:19113 stop:19568 length:456 start_codon:yes stop_codon:yes gene_type:complete